MKRLLIIGAGGHGKVICQLAKSIDMFQDIAFLDDDTSKKDVLGRPVLGGTNRYKELTDTYGYAVVAIGNNIVRMEWIERLRGVGYRLPVLKHPTASISEDVMIGEGTIVMAQAIVNPGTKVGVGCILNTGVIIEHDCVFADGVHISPGVVVGGTVEIGKKTWIGIGARVIHNIEIGKNAIIGAGAVVIRNVGDKQIVVGVPAQRIGENNEEKEYK